MKNITPGSTPDMQLQFGLQLTPIDDPESGRHLVQVAEEAGLDLVGIQDHPYQPSLVDTFALIATLAAETEQIRFFPDVANLPLRPPAMLAKTAATIDRLSGGRLELGLGAGGYWSAIAAMGVDQLNPGAAVDALEEAVHVLRALWQADDRPLTFEGDHYRIDELRPGPPPTTPISIWLGSQSPRTLRLTGAIGDGWAAPIAPYLPYETWAGSNRLIDEAASAAGRSPTDVVRIAQLVGVITDEPAGPHVLKGDDPVHGNVDDWAELIVRLATEQPFRTFIFWPNDESPQQVKRFADEVVPQVGGLLCQMPDAGPRATAS